MPALTEPSDQGRSSVGRSSWFAELTVVVTLAILGAATSISFAALIFAGPLESGLGRVATSVVFASGVVAVVIGWRSGFEMVIAGVQDTPAIVFAPAAAALAVSAGDAGLSTVIVGIALATVLTGVAMWAVGTARLARTVRFLPTTVIVGFLAGTGWFLVKGGFEVMARRPLGWDDVNDLVAADLVVRWLPGLALGLLLVGLSQSSAISGPIGGPVVVISGIVFYGVVAAASSFAAVESDGWLIGPFPDRESLRLISPTELSDADWGALFEQSGSIAAVVVLSLIGILLNLPGIRMMQRERIDIDAELRVAGLTNVAISPFGGMIGYHLIGDTALARTVGARRRSIAVVTGLAVAAIAVVGGPVVGLLPRFVAGGLLVAAGLGLLVEWIGELRATPSWFDRAVSAVIVVAMATIGILEGILVGIVAACIFFVVRYSRIDAIRRRSTLADRRSVVERASHQTAVLDAHGDRVVVFELHGYLFFGSVAGAADRIRDVALDAAHERAVVERVVIDTSRVSGIDSSAFAALDELAGSITSAGARLRWAGLTPDAEASLRRVGSTPVEHDGDLDRAIESAEEDLLERHLDRSTDATDGEDTGVPYSAELLTQFDRRRHDDGDVVVTEGAPSDELIVLIAGGLSIERADGSGASIRLRTLRPGAIVGEIGFLTEQPRTATVLAAGTVELMVLTREAHGRVRAEHPELALELYDHVLAGTADRAASIHRSLTEALR